MKIDDNKINSDAAMVLDIIERVMKNTSDLNSAGNMTISILREITGAAAIILLVAEKNEPDSNRLIAIHPQRRKHLQSSELVKQLAHYTKQLNEPEYLHISDKDKIFNWIESENETITNAIITPLKTADEYLGSMLILQLPKDQTGLPAIIRGIKTLSGILALVLRNSLMYDELKSTTSQLIQTEKFVSIGQLAAGVAHEVNNPLGAIGSSNSTIQIAFKHIIDNICQESAIFQKHRSDITEIIESLENSKLPPSSAKLRKVKYAIISQLQEYENIDACIVADLMVSTGLYENYTKYIPLLTSDESPQVLDFINNLASIIKANQIIDMAVNQSTRVITALKDFSRSDDNTPSTITNIKETINTTLILYGHIVKRGIEIRTELCDVPDIIGYPNKLCQVWTNLIQNAAQAMKQNGTLSIQLTHNQEYICCTISDSGPGIPPEIIDRIFEPLFTTKPVGEGTGLGLDIVKKIVDLHHGTITVASPPNQGATFTITIPINP